MSYLIELPLRKSHLTFIILQTRNTTYNFILIFYKKKEEKYITEKENRKTLLYNYVPFTLSNLQP